MNYAILLSGGTGKRLGSPIPKQYIECNGNLIIYHSLSALLSNVNINGIIIVAAEEWIPSIENIYAKLNIAKPIRYASPGETRQLSIWNGLKKLADDFHDIDNEDIVIIHDAARPLISDELIDSCLLIEKEYDGAMPILPVKDTIYVSNDGINIAALLDRSVLYAGQAPESFRIIKYLNAHQQTTYEDLIKINGSSELAHKAGLKIKLVKGDPRNFKITDSQDLENFKQLQK